MHALLHVDAVMCSDISMKRHREEEAETSRLPVIDVCCNISSGQFKKCRDQLLDECSREKVGCLLVTGSERSLSITQGIAKRRRLPFTAGIHPHNAKEFVGELAPKSGSLDTDEGLDHALRYSRVGKTMSNIHEAAESLLMVAWGECGLDYNRMASSRETQLKAFLLQVVNACRDPRHRPLLCHEREACGDFLAILDAAKRLYGNSFPKVLVHCFTGTYAEAQLYLERGFYLGFTGYICMPNRGASVRKWLSRVPLDKVVVETDCPYMRPDGKRGASHPRDVHSVIETLATAHGKQVSEVREVVRKNTHTLFQI